MNLTQILQKLRSYLYTKKEIDSMGGGTSLSSTLNSKANDSDVVHKTGNETVGGMKTFTSPIRLTKTTPDISLNISDCDVTEIPTEAKFATLYFKDKNGKNLSYIVSQQRTDGTKRMCLRTHRAGDIDNYYSVNLDSDGDFYPENGQIKLGTTSYKWADVNTNLLNGKTPAYADDLSSYALDSNVVHKTGNETIDGNKTFTSLFSKSNNLERGAVPTTTEIREDPIFISVDKNNRRTLAFYNYYFTNGDGRTVLYTYNQNTTDFDNIGLAFSFGNRNNVNIKSIYPVATDTYDLGTANSKWKDVNTNLLNGKTPAYADDLVSKANDSNVVHKSGDETIKGNKHFDGNFVDVNGYRFRVKGTNQEIGVIPTDGNKWNGFSFYDKNNKQTFAIENGHLTNGNTMLNFSLTRNLTDSTLYNYESVRFFKDGENCEKCLGCDVYPNVNNKYQLGTSSYRWKNVYATTLDLSGNIEFTNNDITGVVVGVKGKIGSNDYWRVGGGATDTNAGFLEIASADDSNEPIYVRQYKGAFTTVTRTATLLDASGNTQFPGTVSATTFHGDVDFPITEAEVNEILGID